MPIVFVWGNGRSPAISALGHAARRSELDADARLAAAENGDFDVRVGSEHGITPRWAHAFEVDDVDAFAQSIREDGAVLEWCPQDEELESEEGERREQVFYPFIRYRDAAAAIDWLTNAFGFEEALSIPGEHGGIVHAQMIFEGGRIMLSHLRADELGVKAPSQAGGVTSFTHVAVDDVDGHYERARAAGAGIVQPPAHTDHGSRGYTVRDLEGHVWRFDSYRP